ncbi:serine hydrolase domain-containing protein [Nocardia salmonicida]|uniref:serine hydrolase domain-containing protein n=1 Tax=Nocardia salmonicida TaxID=53431 RepID=UPI002E291C30|nr:serine hydrolase domain-containing protein [Nocardia salmonicida]
MAILERWPVLLFSMLVLIGCAPAPDAVVGGSGPSAGWDEFVRARMAALRIPGAAYAVVDRAGIRHAGTFGTDGSGAQVTQGTAFLWGSVAKPVTARLISTMVAAEELSLDEPVTTYLPSFRTGDPALSARITVRHLLNQTSGLPTSTTHTDRTDAHRRPGDVVDELAHESLTGEPGVAQRYSSTNYLLLGAVVESVTGRPFTEVLAERVLEPLGMRTAVTSAEQATAVVPDGHRFVFGRPVPFATPFDPAGVAYGYLGGTLDDLAAFARASLGDGTVLDGAVPTGEGRSYGLGWRHWTVDGTDIPMVWHGGAAPGYAAHVILLPDHAVVVTANAYGKFQEAALLDIGFGIAARTLGHESAVAPVERSYQAILIGLGASVAIGIAAVVRGIQLLVHPKAVSRQRAAANFTLWLLVIGGVLAGLGIALPTAAGVELTQLVLWAPDIAGLVFTILAIGALVLPLRLAVALSSAGLIGPTQNSPR